MIFSGIICMTGLLQIRENLLDIPVVRVREVAVGGGAQGAAGEAAAQHQPGPYHVHGGAPVLGDLLQEVPQDQHGVIPDEIHPR